MTNLLVEEIDPAIIPDKFKNPETGAVRMDALLNSYKELEKKMSGSPKAPETAEEYCVNCDHGLFEPDSEINQRLHAKGLTQEQLQEVYDLAAEKMVPMIQNVAHDFDADRELEKLITHFGGPEQWQEIARQLFAFGKQNLPEDVLSNLTSSYEGVLALHKMMKNEEPTMKREGAAPSSMDEKELQSMMRDPKYWRDKDPAFVAKVTEGFKSVYSE